MAHVINLIGIAKIDGQLTSGEKELIYQIADNLGLTPDEFDCCIKTYNDNTDKIIFEVPENDDEKVTYLKNLTTMMMIDGQIDEIEKAYIKAVAEKFGFDGDKALEILMNSVAEDFRKTLGKDPEFKVGTSKAAGNNSQGGATTQVGSNTQVGGEERPMTDEEFKQETQRRFELGKKALEAHDIAQAFEHLFIAAHVDAHAMRLLLMILDTRQRLFALTESQVSQMKDFAEKGYALSQYAYGRWLEATRPDKDALGTANEYFKKAEQGGIPDALYAQAVLMRAGHYGQVDLEESLRMINDAMEKDSPLATRYILLQAVYGWNNNEVNPQYTINILKEWLNNDESDDIGVVDPMYYDILGEAYMELGDKANAEKYFYKAINMGYKESWADLCLLYTEEKDFYVTMLKKGCEEGDALCYTLLAAYYMDHYDDYDSKQQKEITARIQHLLTQASKRGNDTAPYFMGESYYYERYGFEKDNDKAWDWFIEGSHRDNGDAYMMLAIMISEGDNPYKVSDGLMEYCAIMALRNGNDDVLDVVVENYRNGDFTDYAAEIEQYYIPKYEKRHENDDEDEEEEEEENGGDEAGENAELPLIAIVKTDGKADIIEFNVEEGWDELPDFVNAKRLDAIRVQPLYDIGQELGLKDHITGWVDNMGLMKDLPMNPVGCRIYPGPIAGDMILTLEDAKYNPKSFEDVDTLKKVIAGLGAKLDHVYLEDAPDDDGRYDAWS